MTRKLLIFFAACVGVAVVSLALASWLGLPDERQFEKAFVTHKNIHWQWSTDDDKPSDTSAFSTKDFAWNGTDDLNFHFPASISYEKAEKPSIQIKARENLLKVVRVENGEVDISESYRMYGDDDSAQIIVRGPSLPKIALESFGEMRLIGIDQDRLDIRINGAGDIEAQGRVRELNVEMSGAASADFEDLQAEDIHSVINGAGSVDLRGSNNVVVRINGAGSATLHQKPKNLTSDIYGVGSIDKDY